MPIIHLHTYRLLKQILEHADKVVIVSVNREYGEQMTYTYVKRKQTEKGEKR
jgi:pentose-5-phosphate-3-epimerase